jgi:hypothetical protein
MGFLNLIWSDFGLLLSFFMFLFGGLTYGLW